MTVTFFCQCAWFSVRFPKTQMAKAGNVYSQNFVGHGKPIARIHQIFMIEAEYVFFRYATEVKVLHQ